FLLFMDLVAHGWKANLIIKCVLIVGFIVVAFTWYGVIDWYRSWLSVSPGDWIPSVSYRLSSPNVQAWNLNALLMLTCGRLVFSKTKISRVLLFLFSLSIIGLLYLSSSRSGWIATGLGMIVLVFSYIRLQKINLLEKLNEIKKNKVWLVLLIFLFVIALALGGYLLYRQALHPSHGSLLRSRYEYWEPAVKVFISNPIFGQGLFTFSSALLSAHSTPPFGIYLHAHSIPLTLAAETGLVGLCLFGFFLFWFLNLIRKRMKTIEIDLYPEIIGLFSALSAALTHSLFDSFIGKSLGTLVLVIASGAILAQPGNTGKKLSRPVWALILPALLLGFIWVFEPMGKGIQAAEQTQWENSIKALTDATNRDPNLAVTWQQKGLVEGFLADEGDNVALDESISSFEKAIEIDPYWSLNHLNLGALFMANNDYESARSSFKEATRLASNNFLVHFNFAILEEKMGNNDKAIEEYGLALTSVPEYYDAEFWELTDLRKTAVDEWLLSQPQLEPMTFDEKVSALQRNPDDAQRYLWVAKEYYADSQYDEAENLLEKANYAYLNSPLNQVDILILRAEIAAQKGQMELAIRIGEDVFEILGNLGIAGPGTNQGILYNQLAFRSLSAPEELVPQVETISLRSIEKQFCQKVIEWCREFGNEKKAGELEEKLHQFQK
ncbi:MAG: hypothetical protein HGB14_07670, partial [Anaerolineaceae bacterium]|nr:hypothetical protein [Anaerolineaceae bacterium]